MTIGRRRIGARAGNTAPARNASREHFVLPADSPTDLQRYERRDGIRRRVEQTGINATEALVYDVLDDELVSAKEIAGFAGIPVAECRRALATLRTLGMADAERRGNVNAWRRA